MVWFVILAAGLWLFGHQMDWPARARLTVIALVYLLIIVLQTVQMLLPGGNPVLERFSGSVTEWLLLVALALAVLGYSALLRRLKAHAAAKHVPEPAEPGKFRPAELQRYARHIMLREIGGPGQKKLKQASVLVIGAGGLGSPACMYLAAAGIGTIGVIDDDEVEATNLQRQIAHTDARIGMPKVFSAEQAMRALNPFVEVRPYHRRLDDDIAGTLVADYDIVLDGTDNFDTRYRANRTCVAAGKPLISAALTQWEGQISVFDPARGAPCYQCVFPKVPAPGLAPSCAEAGVAGPLPGVVGAMMAVEAVKLICGAGEDLRGRMLIYDALYGETRVIGLQRRDGCETCGG